MIYDPLAFSLAFLKSQLPDVLAAGTLVGQQLHTPRLIVSLVGGSQVVRNRMDLIRIDVDAYGPDKEAALSLAMRARAAFLSSGPGWSDGVAVFSDVTEDLMPFDNEEPVTREQRFTFSLSLYVYLRRKIVEH